MAAATVPVQVTLRRNRAHRTLDIPEPQTAVRMVGGGAGASIFDHHLMMVRLGPGYWVTFGTGGRPEVDKISELEDVVCLRPNTQFPEECLPLEAHPHHSDAEMEAIRRMCRAMAELHVDPAGPPSRALTPANLAASIGAAGAAASSASTGWFYGDPSHRLFATAVPGDTLAEPLNVDLKERKGMVKVEE